MNELESSKNWYKRGKVYRAKSMEALKSLYAPTAPGTEPKGIQRKEPKDAPDTPQVIQPQETEGKEQEQYNAF